MHSTPCTCSSRRYCGLRQGLWRLLTPPLVRSLHLMSADVKGLFSTLFAFQAAMADCLTTTSFKVGRPALSMRSGMRMRSPRFFPVKTLTRSPSATCMARSSPVAESLTWLSSAPKPARAPLYMSPTSYPCACLETPYYKCSSNLRE